MHEIGMCEGLVDLIDQRAAGRRVTGVKLRVGARHAVVPGALDQAFALIADGTVAQDAAVDLVVTPATVYCRACERRSESAEILPVCPGCGGTDVDVTGGDELVLESLRFAPGREEQQEVPRHPG
jgi:hydrogenase nickel incorporation protein HypA/HybF